MRKLARLTILLTLTISAMILAGGCGSPQSASPTVPPAAAPATPSVLGASPPPAATVPPPTVAPTQTPPPPRVAVPTKIEIPAIGVNASFEYLGLTPDRAMDAPKDPDRVGWYQLGPRPGERGNALVDGHVDWGGKTRVFWGLRNLKPGDTIIITDADGKRHDFAVQWSKWYDASASVSDTFAQTDQAELTLITCGGEFDHNTRQYLSRLVVRAKLK